MAHSESNESHSASASKEKKREKYDEGENDCLYIGNIDKRLSQEKLTSVFAEFGELEYCYIVYEPYSTTDRSTRTEPKQSRGYGFAKYRIAGDAIVAKEKLQGLDLNGRKITVEVSKRSKPREPTPGQYLGKKRSSPVNRSRRRSYSRSSSRSRSKSHRKSRRYHEKNHEKKRRHQRSRSDSYRKRRSYSKSPRR